MSFSSRLKEKEKEALKESRDYRTRGSYAEKTEGAFSKTELHKRKKGNNITGKITNMTGKKVFFYKRNYT